MVADSMQNRARVRRILTLLLLSISSASLLASPEPFSDIHIHFNWDQKEIISAEEVVRRLKANNIVITAVSSTPTHLALQLSRAGGEWIKAFFSPYLSVTHRDRWSQDENVLIEAEKGIESGFYSGIGELHLWSGFGPPRNNRILVGLIKLAEKYDVPFWIHTESSSHLFFTPICEKYPKVRFLWAHAGGHLKPDKIDKLMQRCPNVWTEVSVRDPWRYHTLTDDEGLLLPGWVELFIKYQDRFMTGTDPVWSVVYDNRWAQGDDGWDHFEEVLEWHRNWLKQLPPEVEEKIRLSNAKKFLTGATAMGDE